MKKLFTMVASSHGGSSWHRFNSVAIKILTPIFLLAAFSASAVAFFYPLEIETRESTVWLHVLALRHGINLYDHSQVAFINTYAGPADPLFKLLVTVLFPFLESWQVTRFAVFVLPYVFLFVSWKLISKHSGKPLLHALYLGSIGYLLLLISAKEFILVGRFDATAALFFLLLAYVSVGFSPKKKGTAALHGVICGSLAIAAILTNWRIAPAVAAFMVFPAWMYRNTNRATLTQTIIFLLVSGATCFVLWAFVLYHQFDFDLDLYWGHFFGVYTKASGHGHRTYGHAPAIWFLGHLLKPTVNPDSLKGGPVLLALAVYLLVPGKALVQNKAWFALGSFVFFVCAIAFYLNYYGGGQWYFIPFLIVLWVFLCTNYAAMQTSRLVLVGATVLLFLSLNFSTVIIPSVWRVSTLRTAQDFMDRLRLLQNTGSIVSEDAFFFRTSYQGELIDMGDMVSNVRKKGYYGDEFNKTVDRHFKRMRSQPPDYVVTGFTESPELRAWIQERYVQIAAGPDNLTGNGRGETRLFKRRDLTGQTVIAPATERQPIFHVLQSGR